MKKPNQNYINCKPILTNVDDLLWFEPREIVNEVSTRNTDCGRPSEYGVEYFLVCFPNYMRLFVV